MEGAGAMTPKAALDAAAQLRDRNDAINALELFLAAMEEILFLHSGGPINAESIASNSLLEKFSQHVEKLPGGGSVHATSAQIAAIHRALISMKRNNMNPQLAIEGMITNIRSRRDDEMWSRIK